MEGTASVAFASSEIRPDKLVYFDHLLVDGGGVETTQRCYIPKSMLVQLEKQDEQRLANFLDDEHLRDIQRADQPFFRWQPVVRA